MLKNKVIILLLLFYSSCCFAYTYESIQKIKTVTKDFVTKNISLNQGETLEVEALPSTSLTLAACSNEIQAKFPSESNRNKVTSVEVSCNGEKNWSVLIPVEVKINTQVIVAKHTIPQNQSITDQDLDFAQYDRNRLYEGFYQDKKGLVGRVATQPISAGSVLTEKNSRQPTLVHRNQVIDIIAKSDAVVVSMKGIAKSDGELSQVIQVYNPSSKRTLDAVVVDYNKVEVVS